MFRIGEFSKISRLTVKTLRHYDEIGLLKPKHVDDLSGYRYYTADQLPRLQKIIALKQIGLPLSDIAVMLADDLNTEEMIIRLQHKRTDLLANLASQQAQLQQLVTYLTTLRKENGMNYHVTIKDLPEVTVASMRKVIANYDEFNSLYPKMGELMIKQNLKCVNPGYCFTLYHDGEYKAENIDVEICESVVEAGKDEDGMTFKKIPAVPTAACVIHKGPYTTIGQAYAALTQWIEENGYEVIDLMRENYLDGIWNQPDPSQWITEIQAPVRKK